MRSGLLLCASLNNHTIRRFPQKWLQATSCKITLSNKVFENLNTWSDEIFQCLKKKKNKDKSTIPQDFQEKTNTLIKSVEQSIVDKFMLEYLKARFTLDREIPAHHLKF